MEMLSASSSSCRKQSPQDQWPIFLRFAGEAQGEAGACHIVVLDELNTVVRVCWFD